MAHPERFSFSHDASTGRQSRRTMIKGLGALGLSLSGIATRSSRSALAMPTVNVAPPTVVRTEDCRVTVSVVVALSSVPRGIRYAVSGDIMESDDPDGDPDFCCALPAQSTASGDGEPQALELIGQATVADLGLVQGIGPAHDETFSPDLVELFARIWLREFATGDVSGPWDSPLRVAVASTALAWTQARQFPGSELLVPRGGLPAFSRDGAGRHLPPLACAS